MQDRAVGASCSVAGCPFTSMAIREAEHFFKRHGDRHGYKKLFTPPIGDGPAGYSAHNGSFELSVTALANSSSSLLSSIDTLLHNPVLDEACCGPGRRMTRVGKPAGRDGGWTLCMPSVPSMRPCTILSIGIRDDPSFDVDAALSFGCTVHMFDHTIPPAAQKVLTNLHHTRLKYYPIGLTAGPSSKEWRHYADGSKNYLKASEEAFAKQPPIFMNLKDMIEHATGGSSSARVDVLKLDCEGCEWSVFERLANSSSTTSSSSSDLLDRIDQIAIELHAYAAHASLNGERQVSAAPDTHAGAAVLTASAAPTSFTIQRLRAFLSYVIDTHGFGVAHRHLNIASLLKDHTFNSLVAKAIGGRLPSSVHLWSYWELLLVRRRDMSRRLSASPATKKGTGPPTIRRPPHSTPADKILQFVRSHASKAASGAREITSMILRERVPPPQEKVPPPPCCKIAWLHPPKTGSTFSRTVVDYASNFSLHRSNYTFIGSRTKFHLQANHWSATLPPRYFGDELWVPASGDHARVSDEVWEQYKGHFVGMFRPPHERAISSFAYFGHLKGSFERYAKRIEGTVVRMLSGQSDGAEWKCRDSKGTSVGWPDECVEVNSTRGCPGYDVQSCGPPAVGVAIERLRTGFKFVGLTTHWNASICLFHRKFGGECDASEFDNTRPTARDEKAGAISSGSSRNGVMYQRRKGKSLGLSSDEKLYVEAQAIFWQEMARYRLDAQACVAVCGKAFEHAFRAMR